MFGAIEKLPLLSYKNRKIYIQAHITGMYIIKQVILMSDNTQSRREFLGYALGALGIGAAAGGGAYYLATKEDPLADPNPTHGKLMNPEPKQEVLKVTQQNLADIVKESGNTPTLVKFGTRRCEPCNILEPVYDGAASEYSPKEIRFYYLNVDDIRGEKLDLSGTPLDGIYKALIPKVAVLDYGNVVKVLDGRQLAEGKYAHLTEEEKQTAEARFREKGELFPVKESDQVAWKLHLMEQLEKEINKARDAQRWNSRLKSFFGIQ